MGSLGSTGRCSQYHEDGADAQHHAEMFDRCAPGDDGEQEQQAHDLHGALCQGSQSFWYPASILLSFSFGVIVMVIVTSISISSNRTFMLRAV